MPGGAFAQSVLGGKRFVHIGRQCACLHISDTSQSEEVWHGRGVVVVASLLNVVGVSVKVSSVEDGRLVGIVVEPKSKSSAVEGCVVSAAVVVTLELDDHSCVVDSVPYECSDVV